MKAAAEKVGTFEPHSPEWYAARSMGLGGSDVAAVLGLSPWTSPFTLWHRKAGTVGEERDNAGMDWGRRLEPVIADKFAEDHPEFGVVETGTWRSIDRPWQIANPDRLLIDKGGARSILEVKTAHGYDGWKWGPSGGDEMPVYYRCQGLWYLDVFGFAVCRLVVLIGGSDYREYVLEYDRAEAELMRAKGREFLDSIAAGQPPALDSSDSTYDTVRHLHPDIDGLDKEIPEKLANDFVWVHNNFKRAKELKQAFTTAVLAEMGTARLAVSNGRRIAQRVSKGGNPPYLRALIDEEAAA